MYKYVYMYMPTLRASQKVKNTYICLHIYAYAQSWDSLSQKMAHNFANFLLHSRRVWVPKYATRSCATELRTWAKIVEPEQRVVWPEQRVVWPEQRVVWPEQRVVWPEQRVAWRSLTWIFLCPHRYLDLFEEQFDLIILWHQSTEETMWDASHGLWIN